jgi:hypothetical protein
MIGGDKGSHFPVDQGLQRFFPGSAASHGRQGRGQNNNKYPAHHTKAVPNRFSLIMNLFMNMLYHLTIAWIICLPSISDPFVKGGRGK